MTSKWKYRISVRASRKEWSRHDDVKKAERVRDQIIVSEIQRAKRLVVDGGRDRYYQL
jgi:hypothetical protein